MPPADLVERARQFATAAHRGVGQLRKYTGQPYEEHLRRVATLVAGFTDDPEMLAAAWLHDVVEDTPTTIEEVEREFGPGVRELVDALTDVSRPTHGNRAVRKAMDREHLAVAPARAQTVKLADLIDNCDDICRHNPGFGRIFLDEMGELLEVLTRADPRLVKRARAVHDKWRKRLPRREEPRAGGAESSLRSEMRRRFGRTLSHFANAYQARDIAEALEPEEALPAPAATQVVAHTTRLPEVVEALNRHETVYVKEGEAVVGRIGREQMQGPIARMWLFGMVTSLEWMITEDIRAAGELDWPAMISPARLKKAQGLQESRAALGRPVALLDCLQLADKIRIHRAIDASPRPLLTGATKAESQRLVRDLEDLRNSLAHAQDIVKHDWTEIVRLVRRLDELAAG
jgi:hypothetical protein